MPRCMMGVVLKSSNAYSRYPYLVPCYNFSAGYTFYSNPLVRNKPLCEIPKHKRNFYMLMVLGVVGTISDNPNNMVKYELIQVKLGKGVSLRIGCKPAGDIREFLRTGKLSILGIVK